MNIFSLFIIALLTPTKDVGQAGIWVHYQDTLLITNSKYYYTNADAIKNMCSSSGKATNGSRFTQSSLVGSCMSGGAELQLRQTNGFDTLFVITTGGVWTPYIRSPIPKPETYSALSVLRPVVNDSISKHGGW